MSAQSQCDNVCTKSLLYVTIRATAITTRKGVRSLLKKLFFGETKKSLFNTHQRFCCSFLRQPDRWVRLRVKAVHQPIGAVQVIRAYLNSSTLKQLAPIWSPQSLRMSAIVLDLVSKGRLSAFGRVSFVTFLWRNKEKFFQYAFRLLVIAFASARPVSAP